MPNPRQFATAYLAAWQGRDEAAMRQLLDPDVAFTGPLGNVVGVDAAVAAILRTVKNLDHLDIQRTLADDTDVMTWFELHTTAAPPSPTVNWSRVRDGRITDIHLTFTPRVRDDDALAGPPGAMAAVHPRRDRPQIGFAPGAGMTVLADRDQTGAAYSLYRWTLAAGSRGPSLHHHTGFDELFLIETGELTFDDGQRETVLGPGDTVWAPRGAMHALR